MSLSLPSVLFSLLAPCLLAQTPTAVGLADQAFGADPDGQWAKSATASSSYGTRGYSPTRATGAPDVEQHSDDGKAWATALADEGAQWLELTFAKAVLASELRVRQSFHPGAIVRVELFDAAGAASTVFEGIDATPYIAGEIGWFVCKFAPVTKPVARVRLTLDTDRVAGWNEIDAVQLVVGGAEPAGGVAVAPARSRHDILRFNLPIGWTRQDADGEMRLLSPGKDATIGLGRSVALAGSVEDLANEQLVASKQLAEFRLETPMRTGEHTISTGRSAMFAYSYRQADQSAQYGYCALFCVVAGGRGVTFSLRTDTAAAYDGNRVAFTEFVNNSQLTTGMRLENGTPPLTCYLVDEIADFLEWLVHSPMTVAQKETVEAELRRYWRDGMRKEIDGVTEALAARAQLATLDEARRELVRQEALAGAVAEWKQDLKDAGAKMMLAIHDAANAPIAAGEPPLTRQAVEAFAEYLAFAAGQAVGAVGKLPQATRDGLVAKVTEGYGALSADQRELISGMPVYWASLRVGWPDLTKEQQQRFVGAWQQDQQIVALGKSMAPTPTDKALQNRMIEQSIHDAYSSMLRRSGNQHNVYSGVYVYRW